MAWLLIALLALAGLSKAVADATAHDSGRMMRFGKWFDNRTSWQRKYRDYYAGDKRPAFPGATTVLVFVTDAWHFFTMLSWLCADAAFLLVAFPACRWYAVAAVAARRCVFQPAYSLLRK